jgi:hypothetical protein
MISSPYVSDEDFPFVISVMPVAPDEAFFKAYFVKQRELLSRGKRWLHLVDIRLVTRLPDARARAVVSAETAALSDLSARFNAGTATVISSPIVRGILTAIHWLSPPPHPFLNVATVEEGLTFLSSCAAKAGVTVPTGMRAARVEAFLNRLKQQKG